MKDLILYHGSRGGLDGDISTSFSKRFRDFGKGFYLGENKLQAESLVCDDPMPVIYTIKLPLSQFSDSDILQLNGEDWVNTVLANRERVKEFCDLNIAKEAKYNQALYDIIIGPIADDRMVDAMHKYENGLLTDKGLIHCLSAVNYGNQYVIKTDSACAKLEVLDETDLHGYELQRARGYGTRMRLDGENVIGKAMRMFRRDGKYIDELIQQEKQKDAINKDDYTHER